MRPRTAIRDNAFIVAAIALPVLVAVFFLAASAVPRLTVPLPAYDVILKVAAPYDSAARTLSLDFAVRDNRVVAVMKPVAPNTYGERWVLLLVDHRTLSARHVAFELPTRLDEGESERVSAVPDLANTAVSPALSAPDGYALDTHASRNGPGLVGEIFGMRSYRQHTTLRGNGRTVNIELPAPFQQPYQQTAFLGWITTDGRP